jgi:AcrR family transcriptional regulator
MTGSRAVEADLEARLRSVPRPTPVLPRDRERALTTRQREILAQLGALFDGGFAHLTMAGIAAELSCSLRTLYDLAPSRDELLLMVIDRNLWRIGRGAEGVVRAGATPLQALRDYLTAATEAIADMSPAFARDLAAVPAAGRLRDAHTEYLAGVTRCLLDLAVEQGEISDVDTAAFARVLTGVSRDLIRPEVIGTLRSTPKDATDAVVGTILDGLSMSAGRRGPQPVR